MVPWSEAKGYIVFDVYHEGKTKSVNIGRARLELASLIDNAQAGGSQAVRCLVLPLFDAPTAAASGDHDSNGGEDEGYVNSNTRAAEVGGRNQAETSGSTSKSGRYGKRISHVGSRDPRLGSYETRPPCPGRLQVLVQLTLPPKNAPWTELDTTNQATLEELNSSGSTPYFSIILTIPKLSSSHTLFPHCSSQCPTGLPHSVPESAQDGRGVATNVVQLCRYARADP